MIVLIAVLSFTLYLVALELADALRRAVLAVGVRTDRRPCAQHILHQRGGRQ